jgi:hypothetical protein
MMKSQRRLLAGGVAVLFALTGCGLKQGASQSLGLSNTAGGAGSGAGAGPGSGSGPGATGGTGPGGSVPGGGAGGTGNLASGGGTAGGGTGNAQGSSGTANKPGSCGVPSGGTSTGITASTINVGLHAPLTGTGTPFPNTSFRTGSNVFWQQPGHQVCGRNVYVDFQDDTYTPSGAHQVCSAMSHHDFIVVGGGGTDQIQACATDSNIQQTGTPYLSAGVTTNGLTGLKNYFAVSLTYQQQGPLVVQYAHLQGFDKPKPARGGKQWAVVTANTKNFDDATQGIDSALTAAGISYQNFRINQNGDYQAAAAQQGQNLALAGYKTIFVDVAPGYYVFMAGGYYKASTGAGVNWVGPGVTYTEVTVAQYLCSGTQNAINGHAWFLAPAPGIDRATNDFKTAYKGKYDDIEWSLWGLSNALWDLLKNASGNLTRQNFVSRTAQASVPGGVYPPVVYGGHTHFGGTGAWRQVVNCNQTEPDQTQPGAWSTVGTTFLRV